ncbi:MAG: cytochrome c oxidase subunit II [Armatimonadota bacterium]
MGTAASNTASHVDQVMMVILGISVVLFVGIMATMVFFVIKYSRKRQKTVANISHHTGLELVWTIIPVLIVLVMFWYGFVGYKVMRTGPDDALEVTITGRMWSWLYTYENGIQATDMLRIPAGEPVKLVITSADVIHSFYVPAFRVKWDAVPGRKTHYFITAEKTGTFDILCAEYCGLQHAYMLSKVQVMPKEEFEKWYAQNAPQEQKGEPAQAAAAAAASQGAPAEAQAPAATAQQASATAGANTAPQAQQASAAPAGKAASPPAAPGAAASGNDAALVAEGEKLMARYACSSCHSSDGSRIVGPTFKGLHGSSVTVVADGKERTIRVDEAYLERSIREPNAEIVKGYQPLMPGQPNLTAEEVKAMIAYIKSLK